jgi:hypothetical protein
MNSTLKIKINSLIIIRKNFINNNNESTIVIINIINNELSYYNKYKKL